MDTTQCMESKSSTMIVNKARQIALGIFWLNQETIQKRAVIAFDYNFLAFRFTRGWIFPWI
jgi:hypothetical protein